MFAVIATGGKQYLVKQGQVLKVEKLPIEAGKEVVFDKVLLLAEADGSNVKIGAPYLSGAKVTAQVLEQGKGEKITVVKYKRKVRYTRTRGHRQEFTKIKIGSIQP